MEWRGSLCPSPFPRHIFKRKIMRIEKETVFPLGLSYNQSQSVWTALKGMTTEKNWINCLHGRVTNSHNFSRIEVSKDPRFKAEDRDWNPAPAVKNVGCFFRGPKLGGSQPTATLLQEIWCSLLVSMGTHMYVPVLMHAHCANKE